MIIGAEAPTPHLYNIPLEAIKRFRKQITLYDQGAFPEEALCFKITWRIEKPWAVLSQREAEIFKKLDIEIKRTRQKKEKRKEDEELLKLLKPQNSSKETK